MARPRLEVRVRDATGQPRAFRLVPWRLGILILLLGGVPLVITLAVSPDPGEIDDSPLTGQIQELEEEKGTLLGTVARLEGELSMAQNDGGIEPLIPLPAHDGEPTIAVAVGRVRRAVAIDGVQLALNGKPTGGPVDVWWMQDGLGLAGGKALPDDLRLTAAGDVVVGGVGNFPGAVRLAWTPDEILVINDVPMERYLQGVVSSEVPNGWVLEAKKAQAVAARSYALARKHQQEGPFAVESSTADQVYRQGMLDPGAVDAVRATRGQILSQGGSLVVAYYHSTCAGHTESAAAVWPDRGAIDDWSVACTHCGGSPSTSWQHSMTLAEVAAAIRRDHPEMDAITSLQLLGRTGSARVRGVSLTGPAGTVMLTGNEFRRVFGYTKVRSTWFDMTRVDGGLQLSGQGSGHGVGMCQWGAQGMARLGKAYTEILGFYYGGADIHSAYD